MTSEVRKAALDAILERIHLEGYRDYGKFAKEAAVWFAERDRSELSQEDFVAEFRTGTDFFKFNQVLDRERLLDTVYDDAVKAIDVVPANRPDRLFVDDIDSFSQVSEVRSRDIDVDLPLAVPESDVKTYLREIIGEPFDQTDWGGERNDLFSNNVQVNGRRVQTAFMLKGPSVSGEMYMSDAGKRGDQVQRLFESPARLFIVQFNGKIEDRMVQHIKQEARVTEADMFCIIDGTDTARLLRAYGKI